MARSVREVVPTSVSRPYWEAVDQGRLCIQLCGSCERFQFYPRERCLACQASDLEWVEVSGFGSIYSMTMVHSRDEEPFYLALVDLDEGPRLLTRIVGSDRRTPDIGDTVAVRFGGVTTADRVLPLFEMHRPG